MVTEPAVTMGAEVVLETLGNSSLQPRPLSPSPLVVESEPPALQALASNSGSSCGRASRSIVPRGTKTRRHSASPSARPPLQPLTLNTSSCNVQEESSALRAARWLRKPKDPTPTRDDQENSTPMRQRASSRAGDGTSLSQSLHLREGTARGNT
jgi:hypothetical protein